MATSKRREPSKEELLREAKASGVGIRAPLRPANDAQVNEQEGAEARELLGTAQAFLIGIREDLDDPPRGPRARVELRERIRIVLRWVKDLEGNEYERNYRWSVLVHHVRDARREKQRPSAADIATWELLPPGYVSSPKACALIAAAVAAKSKDQWLKLLVDAIREVEKTSPPRSLEVIVSDFLKVERRLKGVDPDER